MPVLSRALTIYRFISGVFNAMDARNLSLISAGVAFYAMLAIFPALAALIALWGVFSDPGLIDDQVSLLSRFIPADGFALFEAQVERLINANDTTLGYTTLISLGAALWSTRAGVAALIRGLNAVYSAPHRTGIRRAFAAMLLTICLVAMALVAMACIVVAPIALAILPLGAFASIGAVVALLMWFYISAWVVLLGATVNCELARRRNAAP